MPEPEKKEGAPADPPAPPAPAKDDLSAKELAELRVEAARLTKELNTLRAAGASESSIHAVLEQQKELRKELAELKGRPTYVGLFGW